MSYSITSNRVYQYIKQSPTKAVLIALLLSLAIPISISEVHANAACTAEIKNQIQSEIDIYTDLENTPSPLERMKDQKEKFKKVKEIKARSDLSSTKERLIKDVKEKYGIINDSYTQDYAVTFENIIENSNSVSGKAVVEKLVDLNNEEVIRSKYVYAINYDKITGKSEIKILKEELPKASQEGIEFTKKLREQNEVNGVLKGNSLGQSDEEWAKLKALKNQNQNSAPKISHDEEKKDALKDRRPEYKEKRIELENAKKSTNCNGVKVSAGLGGAKFNRNAAIDYAGTWWWRRNPIFADMSWSGGNCTNYASQIMKVGGYANDDQGFYSELGSQRVYSTAVAPNGSNNIFNNGYGQTTYLSPAFRDVASNKQYIKDRWYTSDYYYYRNYFYNPNLSYYGGYGSKWASMFDKIYRGDVVYADWENDSTWDHTMIIQGWYWSNGIEYPYLTYQGSQPSSNWYNKPFTDLLALHPNSNYVGMKLDNQ